MTASQLANRMNLSQLIEHGLESAAPEQLPPPPAEVIVHFDDGMDFDLLAGDADLEEMQAEEEGAFFSQMQQIRGSREVRRFIRNW